MNRVLMTFALLGALTAGKAFAENGPVVVELYTSQGCSSCPPADKLLHELAARDDVIALALHVDYWDYLGWADSFARPENTDRQHQYARIADAHTVYTPQMIIGGVDHVVGSRTMQVMDAIHAHQDVPSVVSVALSRKGADVQITAEATSAGDYDVQLVRYTQTQTVDIRRGENAGKKITYMNVVRSWDVIHSWDGKTSLEAVAPAAGEDGVIVIVQEAGLGPIVGAAELR